MPKNQKNRKKKYAFSSKRHRTGEVAKLATFNTQILQLYQQKKIQGALTLSQKALLSFPNNPVLLKMAGGFAVKLNQIKPAKNYFINSLKYAKDALVYYNLGKLYQQTEAFDEARTCYKKALQLNADYANAHYNLANIYLKELQFDKAKLHYQHLIKLEPNYASAYHQLGVLYKQESNFEAAITHYKTAVKLDPKALESHYNLAILLQQKEQYKAAEIHYQRVLELDSNYVSAYLNLGVLFKDQQYFNKAKYYFNRCLELDPDSADTEWNLALFYLTVGELTLGWQHYESRYYDNKTEKDFMGTHKPDMLMPMCQAGDSLTGKNLLIYLEQGFGDEIQFVRYLPLLKSQKGVKDIILVCRPELRKLYSNMSCIEHVLDKNTFNDANIYGIDYWMFMMSLPLHFNTTVETIPNQLPYLSSPQADQDKWQDKLPQGFNIGLVWKGQVKHQNDANRSLPSLKTLKPLWDLNNQFKEKNINFISLQKGAGEDEANNPPTDQPLLHLGADIQDFSDTAAIVAQLDLIICVDTAIAHLAGSLNTPC
ncbi:MAG: tetratricopeptide repeat protein, partial [Gammaproteobacteria bacterium]|nr:tetratricopeptide repeat protein [Gammaproteobacteria bacterium]